MKGSRRLNELDSDRIETHALSTDLLEVFEATSLSSSLSVRGFTKLGLSASVSNIATGGSSVSVRDTAQLAGPLKGDEVRVILLIPECMQFIARVCVRFLHD